MIIEGSAEVEAERDSVVERSRGRSSAMLFAENSPVVHASILASKRVV
jgi:hypothetical protein